MALFNHLGLNVCCINALPNGSDKLQGGYYDDSVQDFTEFCKNLKDLKYKYLFAITANLYQSKTAKILKDNGFREVVIFYSSHMSGLETLTLWVKTQRRPSDLSNTLIAPPMANCTVSYDIDSKKMFRIIIKKENQSIQDLKQLGFKRVRGTPIWFNLRADGIIKNEK